MAHPRKIVTLLLLSAGCTRAAPPPPPAAVTAPPPPPAAVTAPAPGGIAPAPRPHTVAIATAPLDDGHAPPALIALRGELGATGPAAVTTPARFRPLCDADGYPVVGNVATKGELYQPSAFCRVIREGR
jgi:hypothetical protein